MFELGQGCIEFKEKITGEELDTRVNIACSYLAKYLTNTSAIGLMLPRTPDLIVVILAALKLKIPFIPIDITQPIERIKYIISEANINAIITTRTINLNFGFDNIIYIDAIDFSIQSFSESFNFNSTLVYILYTSGSTGRPKGVEVTWEGFENFIEAISDIIDFSPGKRIACLTTVFFDIFFLESIMALYKGLTVVLASEEEQHNPKLMAKFIERNAIDMIQMTPSRMQLLLNHDKELSCLKSVKEILIGGEAFPLSLLRVLQEKTTANIYNMYGPTETTIWSTVSDLTYKDCIDIGRPIKNTEIYIIDEKLNILSDGQAGEICIAGRGLAKGYVGDDDLTAKKFLYLPQKLNLRVYRTGDLGKYLPDGNLEYLGRMDNQVKIRGHRIELEEIEAHINQFDGIKQSVVIAIEVSDTDKILEAFFTSDIDINAEVIHDFLALRLPQYMIPVRFKRIKGFLYTANGKIDRKRMLECEEIKSNDVISIMSASTKLSDIQKKAFEVIIANLSEKVLDNISIDIDFPSIGLDSITFVKIIVALEAEFNFEFDDEMLLITKFPTVKSMVEYVESKVTTNYKNG